MTAPASLLTVAQLAAHLKVSVRHLERCTAAGMPSIPVGARSRRYDLQASLAWLAEYSHGELQARQTGRQAGPQGAAVHDYASAYKRMRIRVLPSSGG